MAPQPHARVHRVVLLLASAVLGACAAPTEVRSPRESGVDTLAERLVLAAQERTDLRPVRVWVADVQAMREAPDEPHAAVEERIAARLERELVIALAMRLNVVDTGLATAGTELASTAEASIPERAAERGATHVVLGEYLRRGDVLLTTVRLIDADSRLIVAAVRGEVRLGAGGLEGIDLTPPRERPAHTILAASPEEESAAPAETARETSAPATATRAEDEPAAGAPSGGETAASALAARPPASSASPASLETRSRRWPTEDFETWYQRRKAEKAAEEARRGEVPPSPEPAEDRSEPQAAAPRAEPPPAQPGLGAVAPREDFPWRSYPWLARLLGVPSTDSNRR